MPKKNKLSSNPLGRALIKERFAGNRQTSGTKASSQHFREYSEIADSSNMNLKSVTELNSLDEFLETAELAGTEFTAERLNIQYIQPASQGVLSLKERELISEAQDKWRSHVGIPRRPAWSTEMSTAELNLAERESFLTWRRNLAKLQEEEHISLTPYEKNLEFWRQLWRVIERSDLVVQIVDARDPLLYRCEDLEAYVKELDPKKTNMILINKADLLSIEQREVWLDYFTKLNVIVAFWSAVLEMESSDDVLCDETMNESSSDRSRLMTKQELINFFKYVLNLNEEAGDNKTYTIGMVGYPNVGKSSTINAILQSKKVAVSATPGRTKHFQTFFLENNLILCDCPGLVFPSFVTNKAEMVLSGILSIDELRDHIPPTNLVCQRIPRKVLEATYGINIPKPQDGEDENRVPTSYELLNAYGAMRGFMTSHGQPDNPRSARVILKDYVKGKLLYCKAPRNYDQNEYSKWNNSIIQSVLRYIESKDVSEDTNKQDEEFASVQQKVEKRTQLKEQPISEIDTSFFSGDSVRAFTKGTSLINDGKMNSSLGTADSSKSWKKHNNRNKKEKMRKLRNEKAMQ